MADLATIAASLKALATTVVKIAEAKDEAKRNALLIEFQQALIHTQAITSEEQAKNAQLAARNRELETECAALHDWSEERAQYELKEVSEGVFVYVTRSNTTPLLRAEKLCVNCFNNKRKSLLQFQRVDVGRKSSLVCNQCDTLLVFFNFLDE